MPSQNVDPRILALCKKVTAKRPRTMIDHILRHGFITSEELQSIYGYDHPPRAARDVRDCGIPLKTFRVSSQRTGRKIAAYRFGNPDEIIRGRTSGRKAFSKHFRAALIKRYDSCDTITGEKLEARYLQIDHRIPYAVAGNSYHDEDNLEAYMLLDASSQRAKSWSCEQCQNWQNDKDEATCRSCFEELQSIYGYDHPPRAARDVRDCGIPLKTFRVSSQRTGRKIAAYRFGNPDEIIRGRTSGRKAFSKHFRAALIKRYDSCDTITGEKLEARYLQIDHRIPYAVAGNSYHDEDNLEAYMLLDASSQRAKSWSCEQCQNWQNDKDEATCRSCFWAFPEDYTHIAGEQIRRVDIEWRGSQVEAFERIRAHAEEENTTVAAFIKKLLAKTLG